jgi:hypothetical protein
MRIAPTDQQIALYIVVGLFPIVGAVCATIYAVF